MTDEPEVKKLENRIDKLESTIEKMMPSRRDALKMGGAALVGGAAMSGTASAGTNQVGTIGSQASPVDLESEDINNADTITTDTLDSTTVNNSGTVTTQDLVVNGTATGPFGGGADIQGCRVRLNNSQSISAGSFFKLNFDNIIYDSDNNFNQTSHNWTCPQDGLYIVTLQARFTNAGDGQIRELAIGSGSNAEPSGEGANTTKENSHKNDRFNVTSVNKYNANDTIAGYVNNNNQDDIINANPGGQGSFLEVAFLGGF
jgi:hypothetical protein